jgi:hypothetical protein
MAVRLPSRREPGFLRCGQGNARTGFLRGELQACRHFFHCELSRVDVWLRVLDPLDATCLDMQDAWFRGPPP